MNGGNLFLLQNKNNETVQVMISSLYELLKFEKYIVSAAKHMQAKAADDEKKFNEFIKKASTGEIDDAIGNDLLLIEIFTNFNELFHMCVIKTMLLHQLLLQQLMTWHQQQLYH